MEIEPMNGYIRIEPEEQDDTRESGLIDNSRKSDHTIGLVLSDGDKVAKGQRVLYTKFSQLNVKLGATSYSFITNGDIVAIIK